jgi:hypothetical protein
MRWRVNSAHSLTESRIVVFHWQDVYNVTASGIVEGVVRGLNATIFAYGATGR